MMRQTGGIAVGEISTRSSPFALAMASAWGGGMIPSCSPVSSITRISRTRMRSLTRTRSSRRGLLSKAIRASLRRNRNLTLARDLVVRRRDERVDRAGPLVTAAALAHRHGAVLDLAIADYQHVRNLLQLRLADLEVDLLLPLVELDAEPRRLHLVAHERRVLQMAIGDRQHDRLDRRQPQRERARVVLDQDRDEALETPEDG